MISPGSIGNRAGRCIRTEILRVASATQMQLHYGIVWKFSYSPRERNGWHHKPDRYEISIEKLISLHMKYFLYIQNYSFPSFLGHIGRGTTGRLSSASIMVRIMRRNNSYCIYDCVCWLDTSCCDIGVGGFVIITIRSTMHRVKCQADVHRYVYEMDKGRRTGSIHEM